MNMLSPKKTKYRKQFKGRIHGKSKGNYALNYGSFLRNHEATELKRGIGIRMMYL